MYYFIGNAFTDLSRASAERGALQANGTILKEHTFDVEHVAEAVVHIASMPNSVTVLEYTIMCDLPLILGDLV